ncbi:MAG: ATP synthase F1 subunit epsilon [Clostridiales bacterium]|nr:ATP synthase F1 subunit epsilon [Clostridiales bacterium]
MAFQLRIISVEHVFFEGEVEKVILKGSEGEFAILSNHMPLTSTLVEGEIKIFLKDKETRIGTLMGGFVKIVKNDTVILTDAAEWPEEIDVERALAAKERAEKRLKESQTNTTRAEASLRRAIVRLKIKDKDK